MSAYPFIRQHEWAGALGISITTFRRWRELGVIPTPLPLPGRPRWQRAEAEVLTAKLIKPRRRPFGLTADRSRANQGVAVLHHEGSVSV